MTARRHDRPRRRSRRRSARDPGAVHGDLVQSAAARRRPGRHRRRSPAATSLLFIADNTFLGPALLRPIEHGADLVVNAATKYLSGHGDAVSGVVSGRKDLIDPIRKQTDTLGQAASPFASFLVMRGVRTLQLRSRAASVNAATIAAFLEGHEKVEWVRYPGLASHPDHDVAGGC